MRSGLTTVEDSLIGVKIGVIAVEGSVLRSMKSPVKHASAACGGLSARVSFHTSPPLVAELTCDHPCPPTLNLVTRLSSKVSESRFDPEGGYQFPC